MLLILFFETVSNPKSLSLNFKIDKWRDKNSKIGTKSFDTLKLHKLATSTKISKLRQQIKDVTNRKKHHIYRIETSIVFFSYLSLDFSLDFSSVFFLFSIIKIALDSAYID